MIKHELERYDAYKDSGVEWIREVPEHWQINFLVKVLSSLVDYRGRTPKKVNADENGMFLVTARNIKKGYIDYSLSEEFVDIDDVQSLLNRGKPKISDVLFTTEAPLGEVANVDRENFALAQRIIKFRGKRNILDNYYMKYWLMSSVSQNTLHRNATGSTALGLKGSKVRLLDIVLPSFPEQKAIADYLDTKTNQIDQKIDLLTQKATQYGKLKQSLINETVTRGLDTTVVMKDSGVEWIGDVPEHWGVKRIKDITLVKRGASPRPIDEPIYFDEEGEYSWVRIADLSASERYLLSTKEKLSSLGASLSVKRYPGDFILSIAGTVGKPIITKIRCCIHDGFVWFPTLKMNPEYLYYIFSTGLPYQGLGKLGTQLNLNTETVGLISIPTPSASEIERIVHYLDTKTTRIDRIVETINTQINKLKELRKTLINDVVTGKIKVAMKGEAV